MMCNKDAVGKDNEEEIELMLNAEDKSEQTPSPPNYQLNAEDKSEQTPSPPNYSQSQDNVQPLAAPTQTSMANTNTTVVVVSITSVLSLDHSYRHEYCMWYGGQKHIGLSVVIDIYLCI